MATPPHNHGELIYALAKILCSQFALTPQGFYQWKQRGVPYAYRAEVARLAGLHSVKVPDGFLDAPALKREKAA